MASFNTLESGRGRTSIPSFRGLMQYGDGINADPRYATDCRNMETPGGVMQPAAACILMPPSLAAPIETLARLHRRWYTGSESKDILVAGSGGKLYAMLPEASAWTELAMPEGVGDEFADHAEDGVRRGVMQARARDVHPDRRVFGGAGDERERLADRR